MKSRLAAAARTLAVAATLTACAPGDGTADSPATTPNSTSSVAPTPQQSGQPTSSPEATGRYLDGEYTARGWYGGLPSHHDVTLTIADDSITYVEITTPAEDKTSLGYQQRFAAALPDAVIGRSIDSLVIDRLAGASGCSEGFMNALAQIKDQSAL